MMHQRLFKMQNKAENMIRKMESRRLHGVNPGAWTQCRRLESDDPGAWIEFRYTKQIYLLMIFKPLSSPLLV